MRRDLRVRVVVSRAREDYAHHIEVFVCALRLLVQVLCSSRVRSHARSAATRREVRSYKEFRALSQVRKPRCQHAMPHRRHGQSWCDADARRGDYDGDLGLECGAQISAVSMSIKFAVNSLSSRTGARVPLNWCARSASSARAPTPRRSLRRSTRHAGLWRPFARSARDAH